MFQFIDDNYRQGIMALKMYHNRKNMKVAAIIVFLLFTVSIIIMLINQGWLMIISVPIAFVITAIYIYFVNKDFKKKLLLTRVNIKRLTITIDKNNINTEILFNDQNIVNSILGLDKIIKVVETELYYFLYDNPISAIVLNKQALVTKNNQAFHEFITNNFKVKHYAKKV